MTDRNRRTAFIADLATTIAAVARPHPLRVVIDGVSASGKTTLAGELAPAIAALGRPVIRASVDGFHRPAAVRYRRGTLSPEGYFEDSFDYDALIETLLRPLGPGGSREFRRAVFDFRTDSPVEVPVERAEPDAILLLDGVFLLRPRLREHIDFSIFLRARFDITLARAEQRDLALFGNVEEIRRRYAERYIRGERRYLEWCEPEQVASMVVTNDDPAEPVIETARRQSTAKS